MTILLKKITTKTKLLILISGLCSTSAVFADNLDPWFTGPLLAPAGQTVPEGHINIEPYFFATDDYGFFNSQWRNTHTPTARTYSPTMIVSYGLTSFMDIQLSVPYNINTNQGVTTGNFGDIGLGLGFQLIKDSPNHWYPGLRLAVNETLPSGIYENLDPTRNGTDATGAGAYQTSISANFQKLYKLNNGHYLNTRLSLTETLPANVDVQGINAFGGDSTTNGRLRLGNVFNADLGLEYALTRHWVPALDVVFTANSASNFTNFVTRPSSTGLPAPVGYESGDLVSVAPALEYNFNEHIGVIAGSWFSVRGRNKPSFVSAVAALNFYY